jgi:hypothetical protein
LQIIAFDKSRDVKLGVIFPKALGICSGVLESLLLPRKSSFDLQLFAQNALIYAHLGFIHGFMFFQQFLLGSEEHPHE